MMDFDYLISGKKVNVSINKKENKYELFIDDERVLIQPVHTSSNFISLINNGLYQKIYFARDNGINYIFIDGKQYRIEDLSRTEQKSVVTDHLLVDNESEICAPMPGKILKILVNLGDEVDIKHNLVIVEAMKMENNIVSPMKGSIKRINFKEGDLVDTGQPIIELEPLE